MEACNSFYMGTEHYMRLILAGVFPQRHAGTITSLLLFDFAKQFFVANDCAYMHPTVSVGGKPPLMNRGNVCSWPI